jgi:hypothetical protein
MSTSRTTVEIGWASLLFSGASVLAFFLWLVLAAPTSMPRARGSPQVEPTTTSLSFGCLP